MNRLVVLVPLVALWGCGSDSVSFADLLPPAVWWSHTSGLCGLIRAVDGARAIRSQQGCEDGQQALSKIGTLDTAGMDALVASVAALPPATADLSTCMGNLHAFGHRDTTGDTLVSVCGKGFSTDLGDVTGLVDPYLSVAMTFKNLP